MTDSENNNNDASASVNSKFTTREIELLGYAMQSLKSGPPEIDYDNLAKLAGMTNPKSAANAWGKIKLKLLTPEGADKPVATPKTPKKGRAGAKAKADKADKAENGNEDGDGEVKATPKKTPRKRAPKTNDNEGSPKKRGRKVKKEEEEKKAAVKEELKEEPKEETIKEEPMDDSQEAAGSDDSALTEVEDGNDEV